MKINRLDAHDRYQHFTKQSFDIGACCQDLINQRPFGNRSFYIFAHARTEDDQPGVKRLIWQPRLSKPKAQTNSMLFKVYPGLDTVEVVWMIPAKELWAQYKKGNVTENKTVSESIFKFQHKREELEAPAPNDLTDEQICAIYTEISQEANRKKAIT